MKVLTQRTPHYLYARQILLLLSFAMMVSTALLAFAPPELKKDLVNLQAVQMGGEVRLDLIFNQESAIDSFGIERSEDGQTFREVIRKSISSEEQAQTIQLYDKLPKFETDESYVFYRVRISHAEGNVEYSEIGGLKLLKPQKWEVQFQPDSAREFIEIEFTAYQNERLQIKATDGAGRIVELKKAELAVGPNTLMIEIANWPSQFYFLHFKSPSHFERHNFAK